MTWRETDEVAEGYFTYCSLHWNGEYIPEKKSYEKNCLPEPETLMLILLQGLLEVRVTSYITQSYLFVQDSFAISIS